MLQVDRFWHSSGIDSGTILYPEMNSLSRKLMKIKRRVLRLPKREIVICISQEKGRFGQVSVAR
jgi:hypothetical protein